jgi:hypothetical protein
MFGNPSQNPGSEPEGSGFPISRPYIEPVGESNANSADEVIGEMGLVLIVILGIVVAVNLVLNSLHIS